MKGRGWLNWAAVVAWLVVSVPTVPDVLSGRLAPGRAIVWALATSLFGLLLVVCLWASRAVARRRVPLLLMQSLCGLLMVWARPQGAAAATLVVVAAQLPYVLGPASTWL